MAIRLLRALVAGCALLASLPLAAQSYPGRDNQGADEAGDARPQSARRVSIDPYVEAAQVFVWQFEPFDETLTYTQLAAGVDATVTGRRNGGSVSLRYERNIGYGDDSVDSDTLTGLARGYATIVPNAVTIEAGALASRTRVDAGGSNVFNPITGDDATSETYSGFIGPNVAARVGDAQITGHYRLGYTRVEAPDFVTAGGTAVDVFDESVTHSAQVRAGTQPGEPFPVGIGVGAGYFQEDVDNLDQRVVDAYWRSDVSMPVTPTLVVVGGLGYENVEVSSRDAVRDAAGNPVIGPDGRFVTDEGSPRVIAFEADGLIWDVGVVWRPSRRTQLQATFGHRYDSETFYGSFTWQPDSRTNFGIGVYDSITGFGGRLNNALAALPTDFQVVRDPITGDIVGCVTSLDGAGCLDGVLGSIRSSVFRGRGVSAAYSRKVGRMVAAIGAGYDRRKFIGAPGTVLAAADGVIDESYYVTGSVSGPVGRRGGFTVASYANWFDSGSLFDGDVFALGSSAAYRHQLTRGLSARAAVALNYLDSELTDADIKTASALVGLRYDF